MHAWDALSVNTGRLLMGSTTWKDLCKSYPCHIWHPFHSSLIILMVKAAGRFKYAETALDGKRAYCRAYVVANTQRIKADEKAGIYPFAVSPYFSGTVLWRLPTVRECFFVTHHLGFCWVLNSSCVVACHILFPLEYYNGYFVFDRKGEPSRKVQYKHLQAYH